MSRRRSIWPKRRRRLALDRRRQRGRAAARPPLAGEIPDLHLGWYDSGRRPPFLTVPLRWTPVLYNGRALILDFRKTAVCRRSSDREPVS